MPSLVVSCELHLKAPALCSLLPPPPVANLTSTSELKYHKLCVEPVGWGEVLRSSSSTLQAEGITWTWTRTRACCGRLVSDWRWGTGLQTRQSQSLPLCYSAQRVDISENTVQCGCCFWCPYYTEFAAEKLKWQVWEATAKTRVYIKLCACAFGHCHLCHVLLAHPSVSLNFTVTFHLPL